MIRNTPGSVKVSIESKIGVLSLQDLYGSPQGIAVGYNYYCVFGKDIPLPVGKIMGLKLECYEVLVPGIYCPYV